MYSGTPSRFTANPTLIGLAIVYRAVWTWFAIDPVWRPQWWLDNILVFVFVVGGLLATYRRFSLSEGSYLCITIFMMFHAVGANKGYSCVPLGAWMSQTLGSARLNVYDRLVHFLFGSIFCTKYSRATRTCGRGGSTCCRWISCCRIVPPTRHWHAIVGKNVRQCIPMQGLAEVRGCWGGVVECEGVEIVGM